MTAADIAHRVASVEPETDQAPMVCKHFGILLHGTVETLSAAHADVCWRPADSLVTKCVPMADILAFIERTGEDR